MTDDLRQAFRAARKAPRTTALALLVIGAATAASTLIFSVVHAVLLRPLPYPDAGQLVTLTDSNTRKGLDAQPLPPARAAGWRDTTAIFMKVGVYDVVEQTLSGPVVPDRVRVARVTADLLAVTGARAAQGRVLLPGDERASADAVAMASARLWRRAFGAGGIVGRTVALDGVPVTIVGVLPDDYALPAADLYVALRISNWQSRVARHLHVVGRLVPGLEPASAASGVAGASAAMAAAHPATDDGWRTTIRPLEDALVGGVRPALRVLLACALTFVVIATASIAALHLVRLDSRRRDVLIRLALGASRWRLVRQFLVESSILGVAGAAAGIGIAAAAVPSIAALPFPRFDEIRIDRVVAVFAGVVAVGSTLAAAIVPLLTAMRQPVRAALASGRSASPGGVSGLGDAVMGVQAAVAVALLFVGTTLTASVVHLVRVDPGFDAADVWTARVTMSRERYPSSDALRRLEARLQARLEALPGASSAALVSALPMSGRRIPFNFQVRGREAPVHASLSSAELRSVSADYFRTMGIPLIEGRGFTRGDTSSTAGVVIVNRTLARLHWPFGGATGASLSLEGPTGPWLTVVGIAGDVRHDGLATDPGPELYRPFAQEPWRSASLVVRFSTPAAGRETTLRQALHEIDPELPLTEVRPLRDLVARSIASEHLAATVAAALALVSLVLACAGVFGVTAHAVGQRVPEIAIRMALGADPRQAVRAIAGRTAGPLAAGIMTGTVVAWVSAESLRSLLFGLSPRDPVMLLSAALVVTSASVLACYLPARRAAGVDPNVALRHL